jgi:hypothetical protein
MTAASRSRFEYKYRLGQGAYYRVLNALKPFCRSDANSARALNGRYVVRSLYFDRRDYVAYTDKMEGVFHRDKFRIRSYDAVESKAAKVKVEIKSRVGYLIHKLSEFVDVEDYTTFARTGDWGRASGEALDAFSYAYHKGGLVPTVLVEYQREAYCGLLDGGVRFSFDHSVRYAWTSDLFMPCAGFKPCLDDGVVFEVKAGQNDIQWVNDIIRQTGLVSEPNSKYANAFEQTANDVWI